VVFCRQCPERDLAGDYDGPLLVISTPSKGASMMGYRPIGWTETLVVLVVIFILFGHRLPSVMRSLGRGVVEFKEGMSGVTGDDPEKVEKKDA
jgi:sec-independent protein translocase protein TatA